MALMMPIVGALYNRIDPRILITIGICFMAQESWKMSNLIPEIPNYTSSFG